MNCALFRENKYLGIYIHFYSFPAFFSFHWICYIYLIIPVHCSLISWKKKCISYIKFIYLCTVIEFVYMPVTYTCFYISYNRPIIVEVKLIMSWCFVALSLIYFIYTYHECDKGKQYCSKTWKPIFCFVLFPMWNT